MAISKRFSGVSDFDVINEIMNDNGSELDDYLDRDEGKCLY